MAQATHTPGPWLAYPSQEPMQTNIGQPGNIIGHAIAFGDTQGEADANAALIAAAPDMLAALIKAEKELTGFQAMTGTPDAMLAEIRAAIAAATGTPTGEGGHPIPAAQSGEG